MKKLFTLPRRIVNRPKNGHPVESTQPTRPTRPSPPTASANTTSTPTGNHELALTVSAKETGWNVLKRVFQIVCDASDVFPPLKAVLSGVISIMNEVDVCWTPSFRLDVSDESRNPQRVSENQEAFLDAARRIHGFQRVLAKYTSRVDLPTVIRLRLEGVSS